MSYDNYERAQGWSEQSFGSYSSEQANYFEVELRSLSIDAGKRLRVLDIGFGNGAFLGWARERGFQCEGIEINPRLVERAAGNEFRAATSLEGLHGLSDWRPYDLIAAFDVLEHIDRDSLVPFLRSLHTACHSGTLILFRFPNGDNPFSLPVQNGDVTHRTSIGQSMLRQIAELSDLDVVALGSPQQSTKGASLTRKLAVAIGIPIRWVLGTLIRHLFMGGMAVVFSGNLVAVLKPRRS